MRPALIAMMLAITATLSAQTRRYPLDSVAGLGLHNVAAQPATLDGRRGVRLANAIQTADSEPLAVIEGLDFASGVIEAEIAGVPAPDAGAGARGFVGIAFRVQPDMKTYDAFYLRPTNGRAEDQERRNHATQYISHPTWTWSRLRQESPSKYESYVDLLPNVWTKIKIEVRGDQARLYVNDSSQPVLIVNDVKSGATARGGVALWIGPGTIGHFRNLTVTPATP
jgi:hypothetical protein